MAAVALGVLGLAASAPALREWPTYGGNLQTTNNVRAGWSVAAAATAKQRWARKLDGFVYGPPLVAQVGKKRRVFAVTESNSIYSLDAPSGRVVWRRSLGKALQTCGGQYGITSAPALDRARGRLYVVGAQGVLQALSLTTGKPVAGWRLRLITRPATEYVWSSLRQVGRTIYVGTSSDCEKDNPNGWADGRLYAVDAVTHKLVHSFDVVPGPENMGGIWSWGVVSVDPQDGTLYASTWNAQVMINGDLVEDAGWAERVLQLSPGLKVLRSSASVAQTGIGDAGDEDFGATPLLFQPAGCPPLVAANSKNGFTYVWRRGVLGPPLWGGKLGPTGANEGFLGQPAWDAERGQLVVSQAIFGDPHDPSHGVLALVPSAGCTAWTEAWSTNLGGGPQPPPLVLGDVVLDVVPTGTVYGLDATTGQVIWSASTGPIVAPLATDGRSVYAAGLDGVVHAYAPAG